MSDERGVGSTQVDFELGGTIVPWGRSAAEYETFFGLADVPRSARILDCGSGPSSFCAEWSRAGRRVVAADPIYARPVNEIASRFEETAARMLDGMRRAYGRFRWAQHGSPEVVVELRRAALRDFVDDISTDGSTGRYVAAGLPDLPFTADAFDLVLCSHLLFLYSEELSLATHIAFLMEMLRVGRQVRVYPLLDLAGQPSNHVERSLSELAHVAKVEIVDVPYECRVGDTKMLRLSRLS